MRLTDLNPHWMELDGRRVGFVFDCPCGCKGTERFSQIICKSSALPIFGDQGQFRIAAQALKRDHELAIHDSDPVHKEHAMLSGVVPAQIKFCWNIRGEFGDLDVSPSIDVSAAGHWHGWIRNGNIE